MTTKNLNGVGVIEMNEFYKKAVDGIETILRHRYKYTVAEAKEAIKNSPLEKIFDENGEMAAHTSNETWAREIHTSRKGKQN